MMNPRSHEGPTQNFLYCYTFPRIISPGIHPQEARKTSIVIVQLYFSRYTSTWWPDPGMYSIPTSVGICGQYLGLLRSRYPISVQQSKPDFAVVDCGQADSHWSSNRSCGSMICRSASFGFSSAVSSTHSRASRNPPERFRHLYTEKNIICLKPHM